MESILVAELRYNPRDVIQFSSVRCYVLLCLQNINTVSYNVILILTALDVWSSTCNSHTIVSPNLVWGWEQFTWIPRNSMFLLVLRWTSHITAYHCQKRCEFTDGENMREAEKAGVGMLWEDGDINMWLLTQRRQSIFWNFLLLQYISLIVF